MYLGVIQNLIDTGYFISLQERKFEYRGWGTPSSTTDFLNIFFELYHSVHFFFWVTFSVFFLGVVKEHSSCKEKAFNNGGCLERIIFVSILCYSWILCFFLRSEGLPSSFGNDVIHNRGPIVWFWSNYSWDYSHCLVLTNNLTVEPNRRSIFSWWVQERKIWVQRLRNPM